MRYGKWYVMFTKKNGMRWGFGKPSRELLESEGYDPHQRHSRNIDRIVKGS